MTLSEIKVGQFATVQQLDRKAISVSQRQRLLAYGFTAGCHIQLMRRAPLGGSIELMVRNMRLCIDNQLATAIEVEVTQ